MQPFVIIYVCVTNRIIFFCYLPIKFNNKSVVTYAEISFCSRGALSSVYLRGERTDSNTVKVQLALPRAIR